MSKNISIVINTTIVLSIRCYTVVIWGHSASIADGFAMRIETFIPQNISTALCVYLAVFVVCKNEY